MTSGLPFPADLVETLKYSAAYLDHAGYMANYAVRQFNQLDKSYHQLETKSEARATRIFRLEVEATSLKESGAVSKRLADELQKQLDQEDRALAAAQQNKYEAELKGVQNALAASKRRGARLILPSCEGCIGCWCGGMVDSVGRVARFWWGAQLTDPTRYLGIL